MARKTISFRNPDPEVLVQVIGKDISIEEAIEKMTGPGSTGVVGVPCKYPECEELVQTNIHSGAGFCLYCDGIYCGYHEDYRIHGCQRGGA